MALERVVVIVNPTKFDDVGAVRDEISAAAAAIGHAAPTFVETDEDDPGFGQTRQAVADGATLVCALGGDGTVRAVAQELVGTGVPLGLLPGGTGNLLARNLDAPVSDLTEAVRVALTGRRRTIDVGWLMTGSAAEGTGVPTRPDDPANADTHLFTVMAGVGFDAVMMDDAPESIKGVIGWAAYVVSGAKHLRDDPFDATVTQDGRPDHDGPARSIVVGNCGTLTGGIRLLPEAVIDDGVLDSAVLTPEGLGQWAALAGRVVAGRHEDGPSIARNTAREVAISVDPAQEVEADGDVLGSHSHLRLVVQPGGLVVVVP
jgi:diacylglycerol kinase family enzyme